MAIIPALIPVIDEIEVGTVASVEFAVPSGYEILFLEWHDVYGDQTASQAIEMTLLSAGSGYDDSYQAFNAASSTAHNTAGITIGTFGDVDTNGADGEHFYSSGNLIIFNRNGYEKVVIGKEAYYSDDSGATNPEDIVGMHIEAKDRNTGVIVTVTLTPSAGNFTQGKFILRGLRTAKAPHLGSQDIIQFIGSHEVSGTEASVTLPTIPPGYAMLWLFWHNIQGDSTAFRAIQMTLVSGASGYDHSRQAFGTASSTTNAADFIDIGGMADSDDRKYRANGYAVIFNRAGQEKVIIGAVGRWRDTNAVAGANDMEGRHLEGKDRDASSEISSVALAPADGNFTAGKFWLIGVKIP